MIELKIDNRTIEAEPGETVLQVALRNGIEIPHFCYHPCLSVAGNCRICLVKVARMPKLAPACNLAVAEGMEVETDSEEVRQARKAVLQFIAIDHPGECGICDKAGECRLQDYQMRYGESDPIAEVPRNSKPKFYELGGNLLHDAERCVLCSRCARFTQEISGSKQLGIVERGNHARVERLEEKPLDDPYSGNLPSICPVGAILSKDFLYKSRVWFIEPVPSACTGCSRCCSVDIWRRKKDWHLRALGEGANRTAYRTTSRENEEINGSWLCNRGFDQHHEHGRGRVLDAMIGGRKVLPQEAVEEASRLLSAAKKPAAVLSHSASNEELEAFRRALGAKVEVYAPAVPKGEGDDLLVTSEKAPNVRGVENLFGTRTFDGKAGHDLVLVWGDAEAPELGGARIVRLGHYESGGEKTADLFIPVSTTFERSGHFTNCDGKESRFEKVFDKPAAVLDAGEIFGRLA